MNMKTSINHKGLLKKLSYTAKIYAEAAKCVHSSTMKNQFSDVENERIRFRQQLIDELKAQGDFTPDQDRGKSAVLKELWLNINDILIHKNVPYIMKTCKKCDEELLSIYDEYLNLRLEENLRSIIKNQRDKIQNLLEETNEQMKSYPWAKNKA
jgi:hypothetical protein